jgi:monothiol glutaredoxin
MRKKLAKVSDASSSCSLLAFCSCIDTIMLTSTMTTRTTTNAASNGVRSRSLEKLSAFATKPRRALRASSSRIKIIANQQQQQQQQQLLGPELKRQIEKCVSENKVVLFMKGNKEQPKCGFSNTCVQILTNMNVPFTDVDILASEQLRSGMKVYSNWPTFPQLYIGGEFFGGCDITIDAFKDGSLKEELERAMME